MVHEPGDDSCPDPHARLGPVRTCIGCRERAAKRELLRVVAGKDAHGPAVVPDPGGTAPGRGAHLHLRVRCLDIAERRRAFPRALRADSGLSTETVREYVERHVGQDAEPTGKTRPGRREDGAAAHEHSMSTSQ